jgi:hypothetical protein
MAVTQLLIAAAARPRGIAQDNIRDLRSVAYHEAGLLLAEQGFVAASGVLPAAGE